MTSNTRPNTSANNTIMRLERLLSLKHFKHCGEIQKWSRCMFEKKLEARLLPVTTYWTISSYHADEWSYEN